MRWLAGALCVVALLTSVPTEARRGSGSGRVDRSSFISSDRSHSERQGVHHFSERDTLRLRNRSQVFR